MMPGGWLLAIARVVFDEVVQTSVVHQAVADMREEWLDAGSSPLGRLLARGRGYVAFWTLVAMAPFVFRARSRRVFPWSADMSFLKPFRLVAALFVLGLGAGYIYARWQPVLYESSATLRVRKSRIDPGLFGAGIFGRPQWLNEPLTAANQVIRSSTELERVIDQLNLYEAERKHMSIGDVVQLMRSRIAIVAAEGSGATSGSIVVSFKGTEPQQVLKTTELLATAFIESAFRVSHRDTVTSQVFESQVAAMEAELAAAHRERAATRAPGRALLLRVETLEGDYKRLLRRMIEAKVIIDMNRRQLGDQVWLVDAARLPQHPIGPSRLQVSLFGGAVGVAVALFWSLLTVMRTFRDRPRVARVVTSTVASPIRRIRLPAALVIMGLGAGYVYARYQPVLYRASAVLRFDQTHIGAGLVDIKQIVQPKTTQERMFMPALATLSRTRLERLIKQLNLYEHERKSMSFQDLCDLMRRRITIAAADGSATTPNATMVVSYVGSDPQQVVKTTELLTDGFIEASNKSGADEAEVTAKFTEAQVGDIEDALDQAERQWQAAHSHALQLKIEALEDVYKGLQSRLAEARMVASLERRMLGARLMILDPARLSLRPIGPTPLQMSLVGGAVGLAVAMLISLSGALRRVRNGTPTLAAEGTS